MIQIRQFEGQHSKERDCKELCNLLLFMEVNDIDIDLEPPKKYKGYGECIDGKQRLIE